MKIKMKQYEADCNKYAERFNIADRWDFYCLAKDAWLAGHKDALLHGSENNTEEFDIPSNQIGMAEKYNLRDKEQVLRDILLQFGCKDVRISKDSKGMLSFQGLCD